VKMNLQGRVAKTALKPNPPRNCLWPLFEAVVNSIHAIQAAGIGDGKIDIHIKRDTRQAVASSEGQKVVHHPIESFSVVDNGIGFNEENMASFEEADSLFKQHLGGKGVGRLMWLTVFRRVEVNSVFMKDGASWRRSFTFSIPHDGVAKAKLEPAQGGARQTTVRLVHIIQPFKRHCPKRTSSIADHIIEHCLPFLAMQNAPVVALHDPESEEGRLDLNQRYDEFKLHTESAPFEVEGVAFRVEHILMRRHGDPRHMLHFCANDRAVSQEPLDQYIPDLQAPIEHPPSGQAATYHGYVSGEYLDATATDERNDFRRIRSERGLLDGEVQWQKIVDAAAGGAREFLAPYTESTRRQKLDRITRYVHTEAYQYRHVLKHRPDLMDQVSPGATGNALDLELYKAAQIHDRELKELQHELLEQPDALSADPESYQSRLDAFLEQWNDAGKDRLAAYVAYRKALLSYLHDQLKRRNDGKYELEKDIHRIVFPMRAISDDVPQDQMNLWIIDERLAFHYYLASDKYLDKLEPLEIDVHKRADLLIFDRPFMFSDDDVHLGAVMIVEFKRPMTDKEDPVRQVFGYVRDVRSGRARNNHGRTLNVSPSTPFYAYILCDLTPKMREFTEDAGLTKTPDEEGYIGFNSAHQVYVEMISYDKLVDDARKRNAIFFEKLGLPPRLAAAPDGETEQAKSEDETETTT